MREEGGRTWTYVWKSERSNDESEEGEDGNGFETEHG